MKKQNTRQNGVVDIGSESRVKNFRFEHHSDHFFCVINTWFLWYIWISMIIINIFIVTIIK